ncbi:hypothetical protein [Dokdonia sp. Hel_I_53]|uniref:hypothetical protein n=1 Tax=Dokdonia sp. Hel_I_53 TaxID=1566287 RepID=UPI00119A1E59|nr:hypothetical protein [Dokdonia sp. Hel_I_53]TVZ52377.1 hypothetical protein OD90_1552 [Dokdonia sp. Hel_I_53]TVZ52379.1 hypothetical protein OD90_1554 [Dokdonia sp. Hel_I_53]TVZ52380.1 hypothetical protein OD90_1555 [Dokdonia sp. Hel_I_53]TVZ52381.1 hypothetical protein OD90_1556 [Dokdonia sp. Hel_I_53]
MKTTLYILLFLFLAVNFTACTPEAIYDQTDTTQSTVLGEDANDPEDEDDMDNGI